MPRRIATNASEGVPKSFVTSGVFSTLEGIVWRQANERVAGSHIDEGGEGMVRVLPVADFFSQEDIPKERTRYYPSQSAKSSLKFFFEIVSPTHLDPSHSTKRFSADQMIQFAHAVG